MKNNIEKIFYFLIPLLFTFPLFQESFSTFFFILLALNTLLHVIVTKKNIFKNKNLLIFTLPFWLILIVCLFRFESFESLKPVNQALFFLLFPMVFSSIPGKYFTSEKIKFYLEILKNSCFFVAIGYIIAFLYYYDFSDFFVYVYTIPKFRDFVYYEIPFFKIHPTYFTAIVFLCTAFSFDKVLKEKKYFELLYIVVFVLITFLLLVKINIVMLILLFSYMLLFRSNFGVKQKAILIILVFSVSCALLISVPGIKSRFLEMMLSYNKPPTGLAFDSTNIRIAIYNCCADIAANNYLLGVGFDKLEGLLNSCFKDNYGSNFYNEQHYLSHNYFLYILLSSGIFGLLIYLFYVYKIFIVSIRINSFLLSICLLNILILSFTEDFFLRQYGLFFFSLIFYSFYNSKVVQD